VLAEAAMDFSQFAFMPRMRIKYEDFLRKRPRLVHYTSAHVAGSILKNEEIWMRKSSMINDFNEVKYGFSMLNSMHRNGDFNDLENCFSADPRNKGKTIRDVLNGLEETLLNETYILSVSEHNKSEDDFGRLSMWRAYGGSYPVAIVVKSNAMAVYSEEISAYIAPVLYLSEKEFRDEVALISKGICAQFQRTVANMRYPNLQDFMYICTALAMCTKHPGFHEEQEWRIIYNESLFGPPAGLQKRIDVVDGVPQKIYALKLIKNANDESVDFSAESLLDRIIVGPSVYSEQIREAIVETIAQRFGPNAALGLVHCSSIPFRRK
jgi:hypothetical protein